MDRIIKTIPVSKGILYAVSAGQRDAFVKFNGRVEIVEHTSLTPLLGMVQKGLKQIRASFVVGGDLEYCMELPDGFIHSGKVYEAAADVLGERLCFAGMQFTDSDPLEEELTFEIVDRELIRKLLK